MYKKFVISDIQTAAFDKKIYIKFNYEIDVNSVTADTLIIATLTGDHIDYNFVVAGNTIEISLLEWPLVNTVYQVIVDATVQNIVGVKLESSLRKKIMFKSRIHSKPTIVSPYNFEKLQELKFIFSDSDDIKKYYVELADNQRFYDCLVQENIEGTEYAPVLPVLKAGQYYIRIRCQEEEEFGPWSKMTTFIYKDVCFEDYPEQDGPSAGAEVPSAWDNLYASESTTLNPNGDIVLNSNTGQQSGPFIEVEDTLEIVTMPENGVTPTSFVFEFAKDLDIDLGSIVVIKREF